MNSINEKIKHIRLSVEMTQAKFAKQIAISVSYLAELEKDKKVNDRIIRLICLEFNVSEKWLESGEGEMFVKDNDMPMMKIISLVRSMDEPFKTHALNQLEDLLSLNNFYRKK